MLHLWNYRPRIKAIFPVILSTALLVPSAVADDNSLPAGGTVDVDQGSQGLTDAEIQALQERGAQQGWTFEVGRNDATYYDLADLTGVVIPDQIPAPSREIIKPLGLQRRELPVAFDWRDFGGDPSIKNQASCGSCWAFGTMGPFECNFKIREGYELDFSEQWLVSCNQEGWGCNGGWVAHDYHMCDGYPDPCGGVGAVLEADFPYVAHDDPCECPYEHPFCLEAWSYIPGGEMAYPDVELMKRAILEYGPIAAIIHVGPAYQGYNEGVFNACETGELNHLVTLVGWDDRQGENGIWIQRNSWGPNWGEDGYMRIQYNCSYLGYYANYIDYRPFDCNDNGVLDADDIANGTSADCNDNGVPDECETYGTLESDCNENGVPDRCDVDTGATPDCNGNLLPDSCDIDSGLSIDCDGENGNGVPDECEPDCNNNGIADSCDIAVGTSFDCNGNGVPDACDLDIESSRDCNANGIPDECDLIEHPEWDADGDGVIDTCVINVPADYPTIQDALDAALDDQIVIVAASDEPYTGPGNRDLDFDGKSLILRSQAGPTNCILLGEGAGNGLAFDDGETPAAIVDGFTIRNMQRGLYCVVDGATLAPSRPSIYNCVFEGCTNEGVMCNKGEPMLYNCVIAGNQGGGIKVYNASPEFHNCTIVGNRSPYPGGGLYAQVVWGGDDMNPLLLNCIIRDNEASSGPQLGLRMAKCSLTVAYSNVEGGAAEVYNADGDNAGRLYWESGNVDAAPHFVSPGYWDDNGTPEDPADDTWMPGDFSLRLGSIGIDLGDPQYAVEFGDTDMFGDPRHIGCRVDMGVDEVTFESIAGMAGDLNCDCVVNFDDIVAFVTALEGQAAFEAAYPNCNWLNGDGNGDSEVDEDDIPMFVQALVAVN